MCVMACVHPYTYTTFVFILIILNGLSYYNVHAENFNGERFQVQVGVKVMHSYVFNVTIESRRARCVLRCHENSLCMAVNYESVSGECQLCYVGAHPSVLEIGPDWQTLTTTEPKPVDCKDILSRDASSTSGVYHVFIESLSQYKQVYCDMETDGGGWTTFQRRHSGDVNFDEPLSTYRGGFGTAATEYWLGLDALNAMTQGHTNDLHLEFIDSQGEYAFEKYDAFNVGVGPTYQLSLGSLTFYNDTEDTAGTGTAGSYTDGQASNEQCLYIESILSFTTQWNTGGSSANQIVGAPNVWPVYADVAGAWCPAAATDFEHIEMRIATPLFIKNVTVYENFHPGSLLRIATRDQAGTWQTLWSTSSTSVLTYARAFAPPMTPINEMTTDLRLEMDVTNSWYEIDAVMVCGSTSLAPVQTMKYNDGAGFTTTDNDVDENAGNCADMIGGGWWFKDCTSIHPNGAYGQTGQGGMLVPGWKGVNPVQATKLMFRRN